MVVILKIALRNILMNRKRSLLIGFAIFCSSFLLFASNATMNGVEKQVLRGYLNLQSGEVAVMWEELKKTDHNEPQRFINVFESNSFDVQKNNLNKKALSRLQSFLNENKQAIKAYFPTIRRNAEIISNQKVIVSIIYGLTPEDRDFLIKSKTLSMAEGNLLSDQDYCISISQETAKKYNLYIGDTVNVEVTTSYGSKNSIDFVVDGIYKNGAFYDNLYGYISDKNARELFDIDPNFFDIGRIYLKDSNQASQFSKKLDKFLLAESSVLRAESYLEANTFYTTNPRNMKRLFIFFCFFLLTIIALGLRSTIKMNLFARMKEFGTIRAIGFSRLQSFAIIFFEIFCLSLLSLAAAFVFSAILVFIFGQMGIYVGPYISSMFGGEIFYPSIKMEDFIIGLVIMVLFAMFSTFNPGLKLCYQKITDIMAKQQKRIFLWMVLWNETKTAVSHFYKKNRE